MPAPDPTEAPVRFVRSGRLAFGGGLLFWAVYSATLLPYASHKIQWMFSAELGLWSPREWLHPLFVPGVALLQGGLELGGYSGPMLLPTQVLNLGVALLTLVGLFLVAERLARDSLVAAAAVLPLAFTGVFWEFVLPADPYALAAACSFATIALLLADRPGHPLWRHALAGTMAAATIGFSAAGLMLLPVAAVAAWCEAGLGRQSLLRLGSFLLAAGGTLLLIFAAFMIFHGVGVDRLGLALVEEVFRSGQEPGGTIYETGSLLSQLNGFLRSVNSTAIGFGFAEVMFVFAVVLVVLRWRRGGLAAGERRVAWIVGANLGIYSLFFIFNDNTNGFICAVVVPLPLLVSVLASNGRWPRRVLFALSVLLLVGQIGKGPYVSSQEEFAFLEARYLHDVIGEEGILLLPGCPHAEVIYERHIDVIRIWDAEAARFPCFVPVTEPAHLEERLRATLGAGRGVTFVEAAPEAFGALDDQTLSHDQQKRTLLYEAPELSPRVISANLEALAGVLKRRFTTRCELRSPRGWRYCQLLEPSPVENDIDPEELAALRALPGVGSGAGRHDAIELRRRYLERWLSAHPEDSYARADLARLLEAGR